MGGVLLGLCLQIYLIRQISIHYMRKYFVLDDKDDGPLNFIQASQPVCHEAEVLSSHRCQSSGQAEPTAKSEPAQNLLTGRPDLHVLKPGRRPRVLEPSAKPVPEAWHAFCERLPGCSMVNGGLLERPKFGLSFAGFRRSRRPGGRVSLGFQVHEDRSPCRSACRAGRFS